MKLLIAQLGPRRTYISDQIYRLMSGLVEDYGWLHVETSKLWRTFGSLKDKVLGAAGELPEAVLFLEEYGFVMAHKSGMRDLDCRKCFFADDLHGWMEMKEEVYSVCDTVISPNAHVFDRMYPRLAGLKDAAWVPNSATDDFLVPFNESPEDAIFLSGAVNHHYPLRLRMREMSEQGTRPIVYQPHPGYRRSYDHENDELVGKGYARTINRYRAGFTDCLTLQYVIAKYFEIPATGALLLADGGVAEPLRRLGFIEHQHYLPVSATDLEDKVDYVLDPRNRGSVDRIRRAGQKLVWERHKTSDRVAMLDQVCAGTTTAAAAMGGSSWRH